MAGAWHRAWKIAFIVLDGVGRARKLGCALRWDPKKSDRRNVMVRYWTLAAATLFVPLVLMAGEHPEHPTGGAQAPQIQRATSPTSEHPAGHEHPAQPTAKAPEHPAGHEHPVGSKPWVKQMKKEYIKTVEKHVKGGVKIHDDKLNQDWELKLKRIHKGRIAYLGNNQFFACADFKSSKKGDKSMLDLDFYASKKEGGWSVDKTLIHKVDGKARYTYNDKNEMVPAQD
jgi:hypothetical protein